MLWTWETSWRAGSPRPSWLQQAGTKLPWQRPGWHSPASARAVPPFWPQGEHTAPHLQLLCFIFGFACLLHAALGFLWFSTELSRQAGDAGQRGKATQNTCLAFPSPCMLKFVLCLIFSARQFEIISDFPAIIHLSQSFSFSFANGAPCHLPNFSSCDTSNRESLSLLQGRGMQTGYNHSVNVHDPVLEKLSCCQQLKFLGSYLINHYGEVIAASHLERKMLCYLWPQGLRYTKNHKITEYSELEQTHKGYQAQFSSEWWNPHVNGSVCLLQWVSCSCSWKHSHFLAISPHGFRSQHVPAALLHRTLNYHLCGLSSWSDELRRSGKVHCSFLYVETLEKVKGERSLWGRK